MVEIPFRKLDESILKEVYQAIKTRLEGKGVLGFEDKSAGGGKVEFLFGKEEILLDRTDNTYLRNIIIPFGKGTNRSAPPERIKLRKPTESETEVIEMVERIIRNASSVRCEFPSKELAMEILEMIEFQKGLIHIEIHIEIKPNDTISEERWPLLDTDYFAVEFQ